MGRERIEAESRYRLFGSLSCEVIGWEGNSRISVRGPFKVRRMNRKLRRLASNFGTSEPKGSE